MREFSSGRPQDHGKVRKDAVHQSSNERNAPVSLQGRLSAWRPKREKADGNLVHFRTKSSVPKPILERNTTGDHRHRLDEPLTTRESTEDDTKQHRYQPLAFPPSLFLLWLLFSVSFSLFSNINEHRLANVKTRFVCQIAGRAYLGSFCFRFVESMRMRFSCNELPEKPP